MNKFRLLLSIVFILGVISCNKQDDNKPDRIAIDYVYLYLNDRPVSNEETLNIPNKGDIHLKVEIYPENATNQKVIWSSSNPKVATISEDGVISAVDGGTTVIKAKVDYKYVSCIVVVDSRKSEAFSNGTGTESDPFIISKVEHLEFLSQQLRYGFAEEHSRTFYRLTCDLDLDNKPWIPIGGYREFNQNSHIVSMSFNGVFDGGGHCITGLYIDDDELTYRGLFGVNQGVIKNLNVSGRILTNNKEQGDRSGGICGSDYNKIIACSFSGEIDGGQYTGGISGLSFFNDGIVACYNTAKVKGYGLCSGITGKSDGRNISFIACYNVGEITNSENHGYGIKWKKRIK